MSVVESTHLADENLRLRRDVAGLKQALNAMCETNDALRRQMDDERRHWAERIQAAADQIARIRQAMIEVVK